MLCMTCISLLLLRRCLERVLASRVLVFPLKFDCCKQVSFVDLAGSERVKDTKTQGGMLKETSAINRSLFTLGKVDYTPPPLPLL